MKSSNYTCLHHERKINGVELWAWHRKQLILGDHKREVEILHVLEATVRGRLDEPGALAGASDTRVTLLGVHEPAGEGVVNHQHPRQCVLDHLGRLLAVLEHMERPHHVPEAGDAVDDGEGERLVGSRFAWSDEGVGRSGHGEAHLLLGLQLLD